MTDKLQIRNVDSKTKWLELTSNCREVDIMQTWEYGDAVKNCIDWQPERQVIINGDRPVALAQTLVKEVPVLGKVARIQHGPSFYQTNGQLSKSEAIRAINVLKNYWVDEKKMTLHLTPYLFEDELQKDWHEQLGLKRSNEVLWRSVRLNLSLAEEELRKNMKRQWRNALRKAEKADVVFEQSVTEKDFDFFIKKYEKAAIEKGFSWPSPELTQQLWNAASEKMRLFLAVLNGEKIAAMVTFAHAKVGLGFVAWNSPDAMKYHAHRLLIWKAIVHFKNAGFKWFDLGGIDPENLPGITAFKRATGGDEYRLIGNYEAFPEERSKISSEMRSAQDMNHILPGLSLPEDVSLTDSSEEGNGVLEKVNLIINEFVKKTLNIDIEVDTELSLIDGGIIDSLSLVSLIQALQETFDVQIFPEDITIENFDRISSIASFIESKKAES